MKVWHHKSNIQNKIHPFDSKANLHLEIQMKHQQTKSLNVS